MTRPAFLPTPASRILSVAFATLLVALLWAPAPAQQADPVDLGAVRPVDRYEPLLIAIPNFGRDAQAPVAFDTMPRIIRNDLVLTGWFKMPGDQNRVNTQNIMDTRNGRVNYEAWRNMGIPYLVNASISQPAPNRLDARVFLFDIESQQAIISRTFSIPGDDVRGLAHLISDQIVERLIFEKGIAQTKIMFVRSQVPGFSEVGMMDSDGFGQRNITETHSLVTTPAWGANGTEVYYTSYEGNLARVWGQLLRTSQRWQIAGHGGTSHRPDWNETRRRIVYVSSRDGNTEIYSVDRDGQDLRRLTRTRATEGSPTWSPDGSKIAYASDADGGVHLFVMNADGSGQRRLTTRGGWNDAPDWSPDGTRIAFVSRIGGANDIYTVSADGSDYRRLTMNQGNNESPSWAPNGRHIAFTSDRTGQPQIFIMLDDGSNQRQLTTIGRNTQPKWGPMPPAQ